ncbi:hypothetical protein CI238_10985, partial [Colletotrichum incanum]
CSDGLRHVVPSPSRHVTRTLVESSRPSSRPDAAPGASARVPERPPATLRRKATTVEKTLSWAAQTLPARLRERQHRPRTGRKARGGFHWTAGRGWKRKRKTDAWMVVVARQTCARVLSAAVASQKKQ